MRVRDVTPQERKKTLKLRGRHIEREQIVTFKSLGELVKEVRTSEEGKSALKDFDLSRLPSEDLIEVRPRPFNRVRHVKDAIELAVHGWKEGRDRLAELEATLEQEFRRRVETSTFHRDLAGFEVDVPTYLLGQPEHMLTFQQGQANARALDVVVDINVRCSACGRRQHDVSPTAPEWLLVRGAAMTLLVKVLLRAGYKPTVKARTTSRYEESGSRYCWPDIRETFDRTVDITIFRPGEVFDMDRINFVLSHDSMIRRLEWRIHEILNAEQHGPPNENHDVLQDGRDAFQPVGLSMLGASHITRHMSSLGIGDVYVPSIPQYEDLRTNNHRETLLKHLRGVDSAFDDPLKAVDWVFNTLEAQGVNFGE